MSAGKISPAILSGATLVAAFVVVGASVGLSLARKTEPRAAEPVSVSVAGLRDRTELDTTQAARRLSLRYLSGAITLRGGGLEHRVRLSQLGAWVDVGRLRGLLEHSRDPGSVMRRAHQQLGGGPLALPIPAGIESERALAVLLPLKDQLDRPAVNAQIDPRSKRAVPARKGRSLDLYATVERLERAIAAGRRQVDLAIASVAPGKTVERFEDLDISGVLGEFSTRYNRADDARDRTHNLKTAARHIDGYVVQPGEVFDFNAVVGDRTPLNGFRPAPVIAGGELVDGVGGGTCQVASTLHAAVFFAGLPIVERTPHSRPSYYIKLGLDAAVAYGSLNFRFENDRSHPIVLEMTVEGGHVRAALHGPERAHTVSFLRHIDETMPFAEQEVEDPELPGGVRVLSQRGIPGFVVTRLRVVHDERTRHAVRESTTDTYPPTDQIWRVGTGAEAAEGFEPPPGDRHPEYLADEFMIATQGPATEGTEVDRTAGETGTPGWTERLQGDSGEAQTLIEPGAGEGSSGDGEPG